MALYNPKDYLLLRWIARPTAPWVPVGDPAADAAPLNTKNVINGEG